MTTQEPTRTEALDAAEIGRLYEQMGIATAAQRARFDLIGHRPQAVHMTVVVTSNSLPSNA